MTNPTIICVDDEISILNNLRDQLREGLLHQYDVEICESAMEAIELFDRLLDESVEIPIVISDQIMPGMKGDEFLEYIYNSDPYIRTIMLTGQANINDVANAVNKANLFRYIGKPWDKMDFIFTVKTAIQSYYDAKIIEQNRRRLIEYNEHLEDMIEKRTKELEEQKIIIENHNIDLTKQKKIVEEKNLEILSSIEYAQTIQKAILPQSEHLLNLLGEHFVFYKPKDIIGGDFYWVSRRDNDVVIVAADCTGHGVPGALLSMLGISLLDRAVNQLNIRQSDKILNNIRDELVRTLHQISGKISDGMDICLLILNLDSLTVQFSGANNPLLLIRNNSVEEFKADRMPIGYHPKIGNNFNRQDIKLEPNDMLYLFSDGFIDQFGGDSNKKYMIKEFKELLLKIHLYPLNRQKELIEKAFYTWKGDNLQTDDVLIFGIRI